MTIGEGWWHCKVISHKCADRVVGMPLRCVGQSDNSPDHRSRVKVQVGGNVGGDRFHVGEGTGRPDYSVSHWLKRFSTSSCESVPCFRASSTPWRTLSRT